MKTFYGRNVNILYTKSNPDTCEVAFLSKAYGHWACEYVHIVA